MTESDTDLVPEDHIGKYSADLALLGRLQDLLDRIPRIPAADTNSKILDAINQMPLQASVTTLKLELGKATNSLRVIYNRVKLDEDPWWGTEWRPLAIIVEHWDREGFTYCWDLLDHLLESLVERTTHLHAYGVLPKWPAAEQASGSGPEPGDSLSNLERDILQAMGGDTLIGKEVSVRMNRPPDDSSIRRRLKSLKDRGWVTWEKGLGYTRVIKDTQ